MRSFPMNKLYIESSRYLNVWLLLINTSCSFLWVFWYLILQTCISRNGPPRCLGCVSLDWFTPLWFLFFTSTLYILLLRLVLNVSWSHYEWMDFGNVSWEVSECKHLWEHASSWWRNKMVEPKRNNIKENFVIILNWRNYRYEMTHLCWF